MFRGRGGKPQPAGGIELPENIQLSFSKDELPLYPPFNNFAKASSLQLSSHEQLQVELGLQFIQDMNSSAYYLEKPVEKPEIQRYSDKFNVKISRPKLSTVPTDLAYFPSELQTVKDPKKGHSLKKRKIAIGKSVNLDDLEKLEKLESSNTLKGKDKGDEDEEELEEEVEYDDEIEEEEGDYLVNHYDDELDMVGDSDGEQDY